MPSLFATTQPYYCSLCDMYFSTVEERAFHIQESDKHPQCNTCVRRFPNRIVLRNHWTLSPMHNYCSECDKDFRTAAGLRMHVRYSSIHGLVDSEEYEDLSDDDNGFNPEDAQGSDWEDDLGPLFFPEEEAIAARRRGDLTGYNEDIDDSTEEDTDDEDADVCKGSAVDKVVDNDLAYDACSLDGHSESPPGSSTDSDSNSPLKKDIGCISKPPRAPYTCPLCLEIPVKCTTTQCGHAFCTSCLGRSLMLNASCPVCRTPVLPKQLRLISACSLAVDNQSKVSELAVST